jgi:anaerobic selenocysteine-containing dehydrogenase
MSNERKTVNERVSRRDFLNIAAIGGGAIVAVSMAAPSSAAQKKLSQQQAHYQPIPKSGQRCQTCALWQAPTACQQVDGQISPAGWCILYAPKT